MTNLTAKATQKGNYEVRQMTPKEIAGMTPQDIKNAAALYTLKNKPGVVQVVSVKDLSILSQALCTLPEANANTTGTIIRYVNLMPNGQLLVSYFGAMPNTEIITALTKLAKTASSINGAIFSGYAALTSAMGEEKHFSSDPKFAIPTGITNIRIASKTEVVFASGWTAKKMSLADFSAGQWNKAVEIGTFAKNILFLDRVQNDVTNVVTEDKIVRGYNLLTKKATATHEQISKSKVCAFVQWTKSAVITTQLGLTQEPVFAQAV